MEGWPSGQWQQTVNLPTEVYESSNLSPSTSAFSSNNFSPVFLVFAHGLKATVIEGSPGFRMCLSKIFEAYFMA